MLPEKTERAQSEQLSAQRIYALLYKMAADLERVEALLRTVKNNTEEKKTT